MPTKHAELDGLHHLDGSPMTQHPPHPQLIIVKCWSVSFQALKDGSKRFEYRKDDRPYDVGVTVKQEEWNPDTEYTGDFLYHDITWIIRGGVFGIPEGYCIFSVTEPRKTQSVSHLTPESEQRAYLERASQELEKLKRQNSSKSLEQQLAAREQIVPVVPMHERGD